MLNKFSVSAILCAAGRSTRMGTNNKLLLPVDGQPMIVHVAEQLSKASINELIIVTGHDQDAIKKVLTPHSQHIKLVSNPNYRSGQTSSIQIGLSAMNQKAHAFMICLGDMPQLTSADYETLIAFADQSFSNDDISIVRPSVMGSPGHPVIMKYAMLIEMMNCNASEGCRSVIQAYPQNVSLLQSQNRAYINDIDTPKDYDSIKS